MQLEKCLGVGITRNNIRTERRDERSEKRSRSAGLHEICPSTTLRSGRNNRGDNMTVTAVIGSQWGDEGKGKVVDYLAERVDYVARFNGGDNGGHTGINEVGAFKIYLVPFRIFAQNAKGLIGGGGVVFPQKLLHVIAMLVKDRLELERV